MLGEVKPQLPLQADRWAAVAGLGKDRIGRPEGESRKQVVGSGAAVPLGTLHDIRSLPSSQHLMAADANHHARANAFRIWRETSVGLAGIEMRNSHRFA